MLGLNLGTLLVEIISFLIFLFILSRLKFGFPMVANILEERRRRVQESLEAARADREEARRLKEEFAEQLSDAKAQSRAILEVAEKTAEERRQELLNEARQEAQSLIKAAQEAIEGEKQLALREIRSQVSDLSLAIARKILERELDEKVHREMIEAFIEEAGVSR